MWEVVPGKLQKNWLARELRRVAVNRINNLSLDLLHLYRPATPRDRHRHRHHAGRALGPHARIPVAQLPDIVPPQVQVTAMYPGASAEVLESAVAQPLEAQIVGVDKMIYMKSTSGNDGSYTLTVSFELGTNPDTDTVNVNNRVQTALAQLPQEVQKQGLTVQKKSSSICSS
jgi:hypothetical protein